MDFIFKMHMDRFKSVGSLINDLYTGTLKDPLKFVTETTNIVIRYKDIFLTSRSVSALMMGVNSFYSGCLKKRKSKAEDVPVIVTKTWLLISRLV